MSNSVKPTQPGANQPGIATSPAEAKKTIEGARTATSEPRLDASEIAAERVEWNRHMTPVGTTAPPVSVKGAVKTVGQVFKGKHPLVFVDLLAERLAFERAGVRLYDALLAKFEAASRGLDQAGREDLEQIRDEKLQHSALLKEAIRSLGADPTAVTPSADIAAVTLMGVVQALTDPRVTFTQALKVILVAELADNDGWVMLGDVAARMGQDAMAKDFQRALDQEREHLLRVRTWLTACIERQAGLERLPQGAEGASSAPSR